MSRMALLTNNKVFNVGKTLYTRYHSILQRSERIQYECYKSANHGYIDSIDSWIQHLSDEDMPIFSDTVTDVTSTVNSDNTSATDVANSILKDASLTSRLLKMANSRYYNPGRYSITTITRAVMVLGFDQVRALALSLILIDSIENDTNREKIAEEMAQSFHAAVQAEQLARLTKVKVPEDIFVATLLSHLGHLAFWAFSGEKGRGATITY